MSSSIFSDVAPIIEVIFSVARNAIWASSVALWATPAGISKCWHSSAREKSSARSRTVSRANVFAHMHGFFSISSNGTQQNSSCLPNFFLS